MCIYDELILLEIREEKFKQPFMNNESKNNKNNENLEVVNTANVNVATLLEENKFLTKQANTIAQDILLNKPLNADLINEKEVSGSYDQIFGTKMSDFENINKKIDEELNKHLNNINMNSLDMKHSSFGINNNYNEATPLKQNHKDYFDYRLSSAINVVQHNDVNYEKECLLLKKYISKHYSLNFCNINNEQEQNMKNKLGIDYNSLSFDHGTPCFEIKSNDNLIIPNYNKNIYHSDFGDINSDINKFGNNDNCENRISIETQKCFKETDEGCVTKLSTSETNSNIPSSKLESNTESLNSIYTAQYLSDRCQKKLIHLFDLDNQGWICASEFLDAFTNLRDERVLFKLLSVLDIKVNLKILTRDAVPILFSLLDKSKLKVPREKNKSLIANLILTLIPLKDMLQILVKLEFLSSKMLKAALPLMKEYKVGVEDILYEQHNNKILFDALNLLIKYKQFSGLKKSNS